MPDRIKTRLRIEFLEHRYVPASIAPLVVSGALDGAAEIYAANPLDGTYSTPAIARVAPFPGFTGEVRTATGDVNNDTVADTILVTGPGTPIRLAVISGTDNSTVLVAPFDPFGGNFTGGGFVAAGDFDADGRAEFVVSPDEGGGPRVSIFSLRADGSIAARANFFGIDDANFRGGARVAAGDVNGDIRPDLAVAAGFGGGPRVALFNGATLLTDSTKITNDFFAFPGSNADTLRNGVYVALADINGDGLADFIFGAGPGGSPRVYILSGPAVAAGNVVGAQATPIANFFVGGDSSDRGGVKVADVNADNDAFADLAVGSGEGSPANVRVYLGKSFTATNAEPTRFQDIVVYGGVSQVGGVFVG